MSKTKYEIKGQDFYINGKLTYSEVENVNPKAQGLLFNARFIQGVFNDINPANKGTYDRFGKLFDPDQNTEELVNALPQWYAAGLRAFTVGLQGGGPIATYTDWSCIETNAFSVDGKTLNPDTWRRMTRIIKAADEVGMLVIVSFFYNQQFHYFENDLARIEASKIVCKALCDLDYDNVIIEVANEYDGMAYSKNSTALAKHENMASWINKVREWTGGRFAVGSSNGMFADARVIAASDISIIHGNMKRRQELHNFVRTVRKWGPDKPILINEDSILISQLDVAVEEHFSWGYYNNMTKQEPPCDWGITRGEDEYFAHRMAKLIGIEVPEPETDLYLQGFEPDMTIETGRYIRVASKNPELIDRVRFYEDDELLDTAWAEPFMLNNTLSWFCEPYFVKPTAKKFVARVSMWDGTVVELEQDLTGLEKGDPSKAHKPSPGNDPTGGNGSFFLA